MNSILLVLTLVVIIQKVVCTRQNAVYERESRIIASLTANSDSYNDQPNLNSSSSQIFAQFQSVETTDTLLKIKWTLQVPNGLGIEDLKKNTPLEWVIGVREFTKSNKKVTRVTDRVNTLVPKNYTLSINDLKPRTAYEVCLQSQDFDITENEISFLSKKNSQTDCLESRKMICKEVVTKSDSANNLALASAISSASTFVVVVLFFCCCVPGLKKEEGDNASRSFFRIRTSDGSNKKDKERKVSETSASAPYQPVSIEDNETDETPKDYYINPAKIIAITEGSDRKIFVKDRKEPKYVNTNNTNIDNFPGTSV